MRLFNYLFCLMTFVVSSQNIPSATQLAQQGVSKELAVFRKQQLSDIVYTLSFSIPKSKVEPIISKLKLELQLSDITEPLYLDFNEKKENLKSVQINGKLISVVHENGHLIVSKEFLKLGVNRIEIDFVAGNLSLNRNDDFLYLLLVPDRASTLFPCFDQPDLKAKYVLTITAPKEWEVLTAAAVEKQLINGDFATYKFKESDKMSTYLFSFVVGKFYKVAKNPGHFNMTMLYRETDTAKINLSLTTIFDLHEKSLSFLEKYTNRLFPFQKFDFVAIPSHPFGGMEHVGAIQYKESSLFLDNSATSSEKLNRAKLIAHETAHTWFGNLVTMKWFDDVWMKEVFANFMADKIVNPAFPEINHDLKFMISHYPSAYNEDRSLGTHPIKQKLENLKNAGSLYGGIIYDKAPIMMRQLETMMGTIAFKKGIQKYIQKYANSNADWEQLVEILDQQTPIDLKQWSKVWVNESGRSIISSQLEYDGNNHIKKFEISQKAEDGSSNIWPQIFEIGLVYPDEVKTMKVVLDGKMISIDSLKGREKPISIIYNYNGYGYGVFPVDEAEINKIAVISNEVARASSYINLYENVLVGNLAPVTALETLLKAIDNEKNELIVQLIAGHIRTLYWDYLTKNQQKKYQPIIEESSYLFLQTEQPSNIKKIVFNLFSSVAYSKTGKERLYSIWSKTKNIQDLKLNEDDYEKMAMLLALYQHPKATEILNQTLANTRNPDKQKRLQFLLPALSNDVVVRDAFMQSLKEEKNRVHGTWVITALSFMNHPLRQETAQKNLRLCLDLVEETQRTGDIFFPKNWLNATIGNYTSSYAFQVVQTFLKENPNFSPMLKRKLLQATDGLYRAQEIKKETK
jgi:aminopeptidase N